MQSTANRDTADILTSYLASTKDHDKVKTGSAKAELIEHTGSTESKLRDPPEQNKYKKWFLIK